ncbi:MAG: hypothetical protein ACRC4O_09245, partial [Giesbergeria sp.]
LGLQMGAIREKRRAIADELRVRLSARSQAAAVLASLSPEALEELKKQVVVARVQPLPDVGVGAPQACF